MHQCHLEAAGGPALPCLLRWLRALTSLSTNVKKAKIKKKASLRIRSAARGSFYGHNCATWLFVIALDGVIRNLGSILVTNPVQHGQKPFRVFWGRHWSKSTNILVEHHICNFTTKRTSGVCIRMNRKSPTQNTPNATCTVSFYVLLPPGGTTHFCNTIWNWG